MGFLKGTMQKFNSQFANPMDRIGFGLNRLAEAGGAEAGYMPSNFMQMARQQTFGPQIAGQADMQMQPEMQPEMQPQMSTMEGQPRRRNIFQRIFGIGA